MMPEFAVTVDPVAAWRVLHGRNLESDSDNPSFVLSLPETAPMPECEWCEYGVVHRGRMSEHRCNFCAGSGVGLLRVLLHVNDEMPDRFMSYEDGDGDMCWMPESGLSMWLDDGEMHVIQVETEPLGVTEVSMPLNAVVAVLIIDGSHENIMVTGAATMEDFKANRYTSTVTTTYDWRVSSVEPITPVPWERRARRCVNDNHRAAWRSHRVSAVYVDECDRCDGPVWRVPAELAEQIEVKA